MNDIDIMKKIESAGFQCFKVGGCVRDKLLGKEPHDIDLATNATPEQLKPLFKTIDVGGQKFGITVIVTDTDTFEVATFRKDVGSTDKRHPDSVEFSSIENDAFRRDFTINALFEDSKGNVIDPTGKGLKDIKNKCLRFCTEKDDDETQGFLERIEEDHLRILRAFRFLAVLEDFHFADSAKDALFIASENKQVFDDIANERIGVELKKLVTGNNASISLLSLQVMGFLKMVLPEIDLLRNAEQPKKWHQEGNVLIHTILTIQNCISKDPIVKFACLLHDVGKAPTLSFKKDGEPTFIKHDIVGADIAEQICKRLKFSKQETLRVKDIVLNHMAIKNVDKMEKFKAWTLLQNKNIQDIMQVSIADSKSAISEEPKEDLDILLSKPSIHFMLKNSMPKPLITGKDLIAMGLKPDDTFAKKLKTAHKVQINCGWNKEEILRQIKSW